MPTASRWQCALELDSAERVVSGGYAGLCDALRRGADLRVYTEFTFEEHIAPDTGMLNNPEHDGLIRETIDFRQTFLVDDRHGAGVTTTRQPMNPVLGFNGPDPRLSLFLYNMTGHQSCATVPLAAKSQAVQPPGRCETIPTPPDMPKMSVTDAFDVGSACPSRNFIYHMGVYRFWVSDGWTEVLSHDAHGGVLHGSWEQLVEAQHNGREIKVGISGLCAGLGEGPAVEVFSLLGSGFTHTAKKLYESQTHPLVRVRPGIPLGYGPGGWDVTWLIVRTDGTASGRSLDPRTLMFHDWQGRFACRWFVR